MGHLSGGELAAMIALVLSVSALKLAVIGGWSTLPFGSRCGHDARSRGTQPASRGRRILPSPSTTSSSIASTCDPAFIAVVSRRSYGVSFGAPPPA